MKKILSFAVIICIAFLLAACGNTEKPTQTEKPYTGAPKIVMDGNNYFANGIGVSELPDAYELGGTLTKEAAEYAISAEEGAEYYIDKTKESFSDFYVYQECKVENSEEIQFAYMLYSLRE